jgi:uncharacterized membrane protein HdeD (DUF308 family)
MVSAGVVIFGDLALASVVSPTFIGAIAMFVGASEIAHAIWTRKPGGLPWQMLLGLLYVLLGLVLVGGAATSLNALTLIVVRSPRQGELLLTYSLGLMLLLSGAVRVLVGVGEWRHGGWGMLGAGVFGVAAGLIVLAEFPKIGFWVFGLLLGVDLLLHGAAWLAYASVTSLLPFGIFRTPKAASRPSS